MGFNSGFKGLRWLIQEQVYKCDLWQKWRKRKGYFFLKLESYGSVWKIWWRYNIYITALQAGSSRDWFSIVSLESVIASVRTMTLVLTQSIAEISTSNVSWGLTVRSADKFTTFMCQFSWNLRNLTSWKSLGLSRLVKGLLCFEFLI